MPDIFQKIKAGNIDNGYANIRVNDLTQPTGIPVKITQGYIIAQQSGILDSRLDDVRYYSGDTTA